MEVADRIAVMDGGAIQQIGGPRDLYEQPVNRFVMEFIGAVNRMGDAFVRPHDLELRAEPNGITTPARVIRLVHLGFEVRVEMESVTGEPLFAQVTRDVADGLELAPGAEVHVRPTNPRVFPQEA